MLEFYIWGEKTLKIYFRNNSRTKPRSVGVNQEERDLEILHFPWDPRLSTVPTHLFTSPISFPLIYKTPEFWALLGWIWELVLSSSLGRPSRSITFSLLSTLKKKITSFHHSHFKGFGIFERNWPGSQWISDEAATGTQVYDHNSILRGVIFPRGSLFHWNLNLNEDNSEL